MTSGKRRIRLMGTVIDLFLYHETAEELLDEVERLLFLYERRFSANREDSELMQINQKAGLEAVLVHPDLYELIRLGKQHSCSPNSSLNISIGPLVQLWRIGFSDAQLPSESAIASKLSLIDPSQIVLKDEQCSVFLKKKGMMLDLGALAKGYIADKVMAFLKKQGVTSALINLGGNVLTMGPALHQEDHLWRIGIQNPNLERGQNSLVLPVKDCSVVTSGTYERQLRLAGKTYHHIFSSETGYPIETEVVSLTILSEKSVDGEIWTSRLFGQPVQTIRAELAKKKGLSGILILENGQIYQFEC